ncbi:zinc finger CCCH type domain protein (macronuclear) [Tetrahymena thermophila SB210]|uniref:Zinc finger CCCH type domain protein n=1 Tax=Tetrahymena thermophila (strain SB210) TaxID=312017 RepID=I7MJS5_TETTS|nr:zinc finger CCCH type domain protein [Tetrahymena thermophila SB210]EAR97145.2 zinc finger CCCH type domain protein [Tetrahymena thermophila SB210]|eukprot:XP_001017390.2 zinc finger CCCH type domain protein [Tetrahymena thermophila SB210]
MSNQNNNWMYYNMNNQGNQQYHHMQNNNNGNVNSANSNCANNSNNSQQQQQNSHSHSQHQQYNSIQQQQYNEQIYQAMQQQFNHQMHHPHSQGQNSGIVQPPPGIAFMPSTFPQGQYPHYNQQVYSQQQQPLILQQQQQQASNGSNNSSPNQSHQQQPQNTNNNQQFQTPQSQSPQTTQQQQQIQQSQTQQQPKLSKLQKQYSLIDDRVTQASEEERSISSYQQSQIGNFNNQQEEYLLEHLELSIFKIQPCPNQNIQHNHKQCQYYHGLKDRRRVGTNYSHDPCQFIDSFGANCPLGDKCPKSHNKVEQLYRPDKYKTKFCTYYPNNCKSCEYGIFCSFAHSENDINTELIHNYEYDVDFYIFYYKTVWCPFNYINHDRGMCVYAHNWQDYRRKPHSIEFGYEPDGCESWNPNSFITEYEIGCPNKQNCKKCHGWKELEYHPKIYRTKPCQQQPCPKGKACPYYHNIQEKRNLSNNIQSELFRYAPRNRITKGLFKVSQHLIPKEIKQPQQPGGGGNNNPTNGSSGINNQPSKIAQFNSSHSLSSQNNNSVANYQGYQDNAIMNNQQVKKQASLNSKKVKGSAVLQKMNTCNDLSSNIYEESTDNERYQQFQSVYQEKGTQNHPITQSPPLKKPAVGVVNNSNNPNNFKRSESQQFEEVATQNSTPQPQFAGQEEQKKSLKIAVPFILEEQKDSGKKQSTSEINNNQQQYSSSSIKQGIQAQSQSQQEMFSKDQLADQLHQYDQFTNAFTTQPTTLQRQNTNPAQNIPFQNQQFMHYENANYNPQNNQNFPQKGRATYSKQNSIQSINNSSCNNLDNIQQKTANDKQDDEYDQINLAISDFNGFQQ